MSVSSFSQDLTDYMWKNRILLLCEKGEKLSRSQEQIALFAPLRKEMEERQLLILIFDGEVLRDTNLKVLSRRGSRGVKKDFKGVLLIGKDGGVKSKSDFFVEPKNIFEIIDSMPMRRAEMKQKQSP